MFNNEVNYHLCSYYFVNNFVRRSEYQLKFNGLHNYISKAHNYIYEVYTVTDGSIFN